MDRRQEEEEQQQVEEQLGVKEEEQEEEQHLEEQLGVEEEEQRRGEQEAQSLEPVDAGSQTEIWEHTFDSVMKKKTNTSGNI